MRSSTLIMIAVAAVFGLLAVFVSQAWLNRQAEARLKSLEAQKPVPIATRMLVVASRPLRFGTELTPSVLRELPWAGDALPQGAFASIKELTADGRRIVLTAIETNEPVLNTKITGSGQRATLSALISDGKKASTIRVNDVDGVAGFVLPGDRVDVILSRQLDKGSAVNDVVLKNAKVLAIDQLADERADKPSLAKAVTLEVDIGGAQKLSLAGQIGTLSLALRKAGDSEPVDSRPITLADLFNSKSEEQDSTRFATISVMRSSTKTIYSVPRTGRNGHAIAEAGLRHGPE
jgi:pilus assembly protein CpaB